ncbi:MAG: PTS galactitol transporter subunit IIBC [Deferribacteraceae bacterium]|jgi:PTS system mannose-specific IIA component|nr:PTS galactitol transporter subunit IIBC [Deferribacteraceae bacterium]
MIEIVIITHGLFGEELFLAAEIILGKQGDVHNIAVQPGSSITEIVDILDSVIVKKRDKGILILTDMFGGSPSNIAFSYAGKPNIDIVSGVNLPMLLKAFSGRMAEKTLHELASECGEAAKNSIKVAGELMAKKVLHNE